MAWSVALSLAGFATLVAGWGLGIVVYRAGPRDPRNRWLAAMLVTLGTGMGIAWGIYHGASSDAVALAAGRASFLVLFMTAPIYLLFLGTLPRVPNGWLRNRVVRFVLVVLAGGAVLLWPWMRQGAIVGPVMERHGVRYSEFGDTAALWFAPTTIATLIGLIYAILFWRTTAPGTIARRGATAYLIGFAAWDAAGLTFSILAPYLDGELAWLELMTPVAALVFMGFLSYGLLAHQILDIDIRLKFGISRGTVAAIIAAAAFIGSELIEYAFGAAQLWSALAIAAASAFALRPLVWLGDKVAARALPGVEDTQEYRGQRAVEIYEAAVEGALRDGNVTDAERDMLDALAASLDLTPADARRLEAP